MPWIVLSAALAACTGDAGPGSTTSAGSTGGGSTAATASAGAGTSGATSVSSGSAAGTSSLGASSGSSGSAAGVTSTGDTASGSTGSGSTHAGSSNSGALGTSSVSSSSSATSSSESSGGSAGATGSSDGSSGSSGSTGGPASSAGTGSSGGDSGSGTSGGDSGSGTSTGGCGLPATCGGSCCGHGDGTFGPAALVPVGFSPTLLLQGDVNEDGVSDLVVFGGASTGAVLLGDGVGGFSAGVAPAFIFGVSHAALGDVDGDGHLDIVGVGWEPLDGGTSQTLVQVLHGLGDGTFQSAQLLPLSARPWQLAVVDLDGDGRPEILVGPGERLPNGEYRVAAVVRGWDDGGLEQVDGLGIWPPFQNNPEFMGAMATGDVNGDGRPDVATTINSSGAAVNLSLADGGYGPRVPVSGYTSPFTLGGVLLGDLNADGRADAIQFDGYTGVVVSLALGDGGFGVQTGYYGNGHFAGVLGDLNGDGHADLATCGSSSSMRVALGNGHGGLGLFGDFVADGNPYGLQCGQIVLGDFNRDGRLDAAMVASPSGGIAVLLGQ